jgi:O-antigen/teichoic acid export membrane protein
VIAWQGQHAYLMITLMALAANLVGNLALIPSHGMVGAAASTLVTELVVCAGCLVALQRLGRPDGVPSIDPGVDLSHSSVGAQ